MKKKIIGGFLTAILLSLAILPAPSAQARVQDFSELYLELTLPEDALVLTPNTPNTDETWGKAGIFDVASEKKSMSSMGIKAIFFDPETKTLVRLLQKQSSQTDEIYNLSLISGQEREAFFQSLVETEDETTKATIETVPHEEAIFFRYHLQVTQSDTTATEVIYGTIVNGYTYSYDIYQSGSTAPIDETFIKELVDGTHFTLFLDKAEVEKQRKDAANRLIIQLAALILVIIVWSILVRMRNKKQKVLKSQRSDALARFYAAKRQREESNVKEEVLFTNRTKYSEDVVKDFYQYNHSTKKIKIWITVAIAFLLVLFLLYRSSAGLLGCIIAIVLMFIFIYYQVINVEKLIARTMKSYDKTKGMVAVFTFYSDYFTLSGIQYISTYPYLQITEIKQHKDYIYLYLGPEKALYLKKDGFEGDPEACLKLMQEAIKTQ
ncbi:hypothetical protein HNQ56_003980 [Anaerotaenia torta]|uniref:YcxB family protein n=1 Tax=Anaerotaenia torta TaxID=433293 RepID=UPI003D23518B